MYLKTQAELSLMSWQDLRAHYNKCVSSCALTEAQGRKVSESEKEYLEDLLHLIQIHCENPASKLAQQMDQRSFEYTLSLYNQ